MRKCIAYDEVIKALTLGEAEFKARYPAPAVRRPGQETRLLYERVLEERRNVVVGHRAKMTGGGGGKGSEEEEGRGAAPTTEEAKFLAACQRIDRKKTGLVR
jgi:hypothetical protein